MPERESMDINRFKVPLGGRQIETSKYVIMIHVFFFCGGKDLSNHPNFVSAGAPHPRARSLGGLFSGLAPDLTAVCGFMVLELDRNILFTTLKK